MQTHALLLEGKSENGLYPLKHQRNSLKNKCQFIALFGIRTNLSGWHSRLGHSSHVIVSHIIQKHHLPIENGDFNNKVICDSCQLGKITRLPFSASNIISSHPLELIHSDVWVSPVTSVSGCKYHVIFVVDYSCYIPFDLKLKFIIALLNLKL
jgi:hypothetical protein